MFTRNSARLVSARRAAARFSLGGSDMRRSIYLKSTVFSAAAVAIAGLCRSGLSRRRRRLPDHQDRHQPVLRQDEGRRHRQGQGTRRRPEVLCRQDRRRQRKPGCGDRNLHRRRRQGHPDHRIRHQGASFDSVKKARDAGILVIALDTPLDPIDAADATFATDNLQAGELIGAWAAGDARRQGQGRQDRLPRPDPVAADRRRAARPGLHEGLRHRRRRTPTRSATRTIRASSAMT